MTDGRAGGAAAAASDGTGRQGDASGRSPTIRPSSGRNASDTGGPITNTGDL